MKILKEEKKELLPIDFITSFVSKGWEEIGNLKASIEGIKQTFKGTSKVENILQSLVDSYLIAIGQLELFLDNKDYLDFPEDTSLNEDLSKDAEEELAKLIIDEKEAIEGYNDTVDKLAGKEEISQKATAVLKHISDEELEHIDELAKIVAGKESEVEITNNNNKEKSQEIDENDFFNSDFDDVEPDNDLIESDFRKWQELKSNQ